MPTALQALQNPSDPLGLTPAPNAELILRSFGGIIWYLQKSFLDQQVLDAAHFSGYTPPDQTHSTQNRRHMVLDATTLHNLRGIGEDFSLYRTIDYCCTKFGKRLLHSWICSPSAEIGVIVDRQRAVTELYHDTELLQNVRMTLAKLPDLERLLAVLHGFGNPKPNHPDTRAILYEMATYNKKKIADFVATLNGFENLMKMPEITTGTTAKLLRKLTQKSPAGEFPEMKEILGYFKDTFDFEDAQKSGVLAPEKGDDDEFDSIAEQIEELEQEMKIYLKEQEKFFGCKLAYFGNDKKRYQIDVPEAAARKAGDDYHLESQKKGKQGAKRFHTTETKVSLRKRISWVVSKLYFDGL